MQILDLLLERSFFAAMCGLNSCNLVCLLALLLQQFFVGKRLAEIQVRSHVGLDRLDLAAEVVVVASLAELVEET